MAVVSTFTWAVGSRILFHARSHPSIVQPVSLRFFVRGAITSTTRAPATISYDTEHQNYTYTYAEESYPVDFGIEEILVRMAFGLEHLLQCHHEVRQYHKHDAQRFADKFAAVELLVGFLMECKLCSPSVTSCRPLLLLDPIVVFSGFHEVTVLALALAHVMLVFSWT